MTHTELINRIMTFVGFVPWKLELFFLNQFIV